MTGYHQITSADIMTIYVIASVVIMAIIITAALIVTRGQK